MSDTATGWVIGTAFAVGYGAAILLVTIVGGRAAARWSWQLPVGIALWAMASLATGMATSSAALIVARMFVGGGQALFIPAAVTWIVAEGGRVDRRAMGLARFTAAASVGRSLGLLAIGLAIVLAGWLGSGLAGAWRWAYVVTTLPNVALLAFVIGRRHRDPAGPPAMREASGPVGWAPPVYILLMLLPFILTQAFAAWLPTLFVLDRNLTPQGAAGWLGVLTLVGGTAGQLVAGWLMVRAPGWRQAAPLVIVGAMVAALPGVWLVGWGPGAALATAGVLWVDLTLGLAVFAALFGWQQLIAPARRIVGNGLFFAIITVAGVGLGPLLTGVVADRGAPLRLALMATMAGCTIAAAIVALIAHPLYRRHART